MRSSRKRLPEKLLQYLFEHTGVALMAEAATEKQWQGRWGATRKSWFFDGRSPIAGSRGGEMLGWLM